jgi:hypothetical protein
MKLVRIFDTSSQAELAQKILKDGGIEAVVLEDKFDGVPIQEFNVPARYRLLVEDNDYQKTINYIAGKLRENKLKS